MYILCKKISLDPLLDEASNHLIFDIYTYFINQIEDLKTMPHLSTQPKGIYILYLPLDLGMVSQRSAKYI